MTEDDAEEDTEPGLVPDTDPRHIDPAGDLADAVKSGELELTSDDDQDAEQLQEFVERAEAGEFDPVDLGVEATVRIARTLLDDLDGEQDADRGV